MTYVVGVTRRIPSASVQSISVTDVRTVLPVVLARLKEGGRDAAPVLIGRHREPMAVLISVEQFYEYCDFVCALIGDGDGGGRSGGGGGGGRARGGGRGAGKDRGRGGGAPKIGA